MNGFSDQSKTNLLTYQSSSKTPLTTEQLTDHDNKNGTYKDDLVVQVIHHWKLKTANNQSLHDNQISSTYSSNVNTTTSNLSNEIPSNQTDKNSNKEDLSLNIDKAEKMKKRVTPIPASYLRRRPNLKTDPSNLQLLSPNNKTKPNGTTTTTKKPKNSSPIFIAPKRQPPQPLCFTTRSFDDSLQIKRKPILERQTAFPDDHNSSSTTSWTPTPLSVSPVRGFFQSSNNSPDEDSSDDSDNESLLIRKKISTVKHQQFHSSFPTYTNIPSAIFITDPSGHSHTFDPDKYTQQQSDDDYTEQISDENSDSTDTNTLCPNSTFDKSSLPEIEICPPTPTVIHDKHTLDIIGEEEEEGDNNLDEEKIFTKELDRIETLARSRQTNLNAQQKDIVQIQPEPLGRRWSDGIANEEKKQNSTTQPPLTKMSSAASIVKPTENPPTKLSKAKYFLMKLLPTSSSKDDASSTNPPKKRTVHRSGDKKRYQTQ